MHAPMFVAPTAFTTPEPPPGTVELADVMKQILEVQKEQLAFMRAQQSAQDGPTRWRSFLARWDVDFPGLASDCKQVLPHLERSYLSMIREMLDRLKDDNGDDLDSEFTLGEFLDRYGMRLSQLGNILGQIGPLAEAAPVRTDDVPPST
jgi:hypothetical protein